MNFKTVNYNKVCNRCKNTNEPDSKFCAYCGASFIIGKKDKFNAYSKNQLGKFRSKLNHMKDNKK